MAAIRVQLTTYLTTEEQLKEWEVVKSHFDNQGDAAVLRELIRNKAIDISKGATKRQAIDEIRRDIQDLRQENAAMRTDIDAIKALLFVLCEKVGVTG